MNLSMSDISKAFDKVNHYCMFIKLMNRNVPVYTLRQKTAPVYFCNQVFLYLNDYWYTYTLINLEQSDIETINRL